MSDLNPVQLYSLLRDSNPLFSAFQTLGNTTTLRTIATSLVKPTAVAGASGVNPTAIFDNSKVRATTALIAFAATAANNVKTAIRLVGYAKMGNSGLYLPTSYFLGEVQAGNFDVSTALSETTAYLADNFSLKTYASPYVNYIEPTADSSACLLVVDMRGASLLAIDFATGAATAATKVQGWIGVN